MTQAEATRIAIVGTGANGASIGADMIRAGLDVTFIEQWPSHVEAMRRNGLTVHLPTETQVTPVRALHLCEVAERHEPFDLVFVSVKTYDTRWATELIKPLLHERSAVIGLQNGMTIDDVASIVGPSRTIGAVLGIAANMLDPGVVTRQYAPDGTWLTVGALDGERRPALEAAASALAHAGNVSVSSDIRAAKWMKLIANIPEMLPSAILGVPLLQAAGIDGIRDVMDEAAKEAYRVARAAGIEMVPVLGKTAAEVPDSEQYASDLLDTILLHFSRPDTRVAVLQDWEKGRRAELDGFNGTVLEVGARAGVDAPINAAILGIAERIERGELTPSVTNAPLLTALLP